MKPDLKKYLDQYDKLEELKFSVKKILEEIKNNKIPKNQIERKYKKLINEYQKIEKTLSNKPFNINTKNIPIQKFNAELQDTLDRQKAFTKIVHQAFQIINNYGLDIDNEFHPSFRGGRCSYYRNFYQSASFFLTPTPIGLLAQPSIKLLTYPTIGLLI